MRFALRDLLLNLSSFQYTNQLQVAIYGAGEAGAQLAAALRLAGNHKIVAFLETILPTGVDQSTVSLFTRLRY